MNLLIWALYGVAFAFSVVLILQDMVQFSCYVYLLLALYVEYLAAIYVTSSVIRNDVRVWSEEYQYLMFELAFRIRFCMTRRYLQRLLFKKYQSRPVTAKQVMSA